MGRFKDREWDLPHAEGDTSKISTWQAVQIAVLMDIRDELQAIRRRLDCYETLQIPRVLKRISANTAKPRKPKGASSP